MPMRKPADPGVTGGAAGGGVRVDPEVSALLPTLVEYITLDKWDDGSPRVRSTVNVFFEGSIWKLCLNDRALGRTGWASGMTPLEAFSALEARLADGTIEWRGNDGPRSGKGRRG